MIVVIEEGGTTSAVAIAEEAAAAATETTTPFAGAGRHRRAGLSASSAPRMDIVPTPAPALSFRTGNPLTPPTRVTNSSLLREDKDSACPGTPAGSSPVQTTNAPEALRRTPARSAGPPIITPVVGGACERDRVITPYHADRFESELRRWGLWEEYGYLPTRLRFGFPIGNMVPLARTFTPENHKGAKENMEFIEKYVAEQVEMGHMTGPYPREHVERILGGPFRSSLLSVVEKAGSSGGWRLIQNCSFPDEFGVSVNDMIDSDDFPTKWGTAAEVAEIVSHFFI